MFWIWTPDPRRGYGVTYTTPRDEAVRAEIRRAADLFASLRNERPPRPLLYAGHHLVPRQFAFTRPDTDVASRPDMTVRDDRTLLHEDARPKHGANDAPGHPAPGRHQAVLDPGRSGEVRRRTLGGRGEDRPARVVELERW